MMTKPTSNGSNRDRRVQDAAYRRKRKQLGIDTMEAGRKLADEEIEFWRMLKKYLGILGTAKLKAIIDNPNYIDEFVAQAKTRKEYMSDMIKQSEEQL